MFVKYRLVIFVCLYLWTECSIGIIGEQKGLFNEMDMVAGLSIMLVPFGPMTKNPLQCNLFIFANNALHFLFAVVAEHPIHYSHSCLHMQSTLSTFPCLTFLFLMVSPVCVVFANKKKIARHLWDLFVAAAHCFLSHITYC